MAGFKPVWHFAVYDADPFTGADVVCGERPRIVEDVETMRADDCSSLDVEARVRLGAVTPAAAASLLRSIADRIEKHGLPDPPEWLPGE